MSQVTYNNEISLSKIKQSAILLHFFFKCISPHIMSGDLRCNDYAQGSGEMTQTCLLLNIVSERIK